MPDTTSQPPIESSSEQSPIAETAAVTEHNRQQPASDDVGIKRVWPRWLTPNDQLIVGLLVMAALILMVVHWIRLSGWGVQPVEIKRLPERWYEYKIDINEATWVEWVQLEGIGETLAGRIVAYRKQHGPFQNIDALQQIKGIGPITVEKLRPWLKIDSGKSIRHMPQADRPNSRK